MRESAIERDIARYCDAQGWLCLKLVDKGGRGFPDRTIIGPSFAAFVEIKKPGGRVSLHQQRRLASLRELGFVAEVVTSIEEFKQCLVHIPISKP